MFHSSLLFSPAQLVPGGGRGTLGELFPARHSRPFGGHPQPRRPPSALLKDAHLLPAQKWGAGRQAAPPSRARGPRAPPRRARTALGLSTPHSFGSCRWGSFGAGWWHLAKAKAGTEKTKRHPREQQGQPCRAAQPRGGMTLPPLPGAEGPSIGIFVLLAKRPADLAEGTAQIFLRHRASLHAPPSVDGSPEIKLSLLSLPWMLVCHQRQAWEGTGNPFANKQTNKLPTFQTYTQTTHCWCFVCDSQASLFHLYRGWKRWGG